MKKMTSLSIILSLMAILCACSGSPGRARMAFGTLEVHLTDAPIDLSTIQSVNVAITGVIVYPRDDLGVMHTVSGGGPIHLMQHPATFDLLTLTDGATDLLASGEVPAGEYSRIRLEVSDAWMIDDENATIPLKLEPHKVDVPIRFRVIGGQQTAVTLDFDAAASVKVNETSSDQFILRPVVTPVP